MKTQRFSTLLSAFAVISSFASATADPLESGFANPPARAAAWCYYYRVSDNISKEGITKYLEAMKRIGIGEALIGNIFLDNQPAGKIKVLSEEWWQLVEHAIREGGRLGVNIGMFNCPGWSQSGGPWVTAEQTMRYVISSDTRVTGIWQTVWLEEVPAHRITDIKLLTPPAGAAMRFYPSPDFPMKDARFNDYIKVVGEFGGHGLPGEGHLWNPGKHNWGYGGLPKDKEEYFARYEKSIEQLNGLKAQGVAAGVYTQTTDVEGEINGLMTYDRKVAKTPAPRLAELHERLGAEIKR